MTAVSYPTRPAFASLPLRIAAARASASLYLVDGEELVRDYIQSEQKRVVSTLCLPAQASAPRIDLDAVRTPTRVLKARYQLTHPAVIKSGPVICLSAPKPEDDPTPPTSPAAAQALDKFIDVMKQAIDAEAALIDADPVIAWSLQSKALAAWNNACGYADRYINHYGLYYSNMFGISRQADHALLWDVKLRPVQQAVA